MVAIKSFAVVSEVVARVTNPLCEDLAIVVECPVVVWSTSLTIADDGVYLLHNAGSVPNKRHSSYAVSKLALRV